MSLSTNAISSGYFCHYCSDTRQEGALEGWRKELRRRLILSEDGSAEFLRKYVPTRARCPPPGDVGKALAKFAKWKPQKGKEVKSYPHLLAGLAALVSSFPADKRPSFMACNEIKQYFPFSSFSKNHHSTYPDIAVSFPGQTLDEDQSPDWFSFSAIMEAKALSKEDPFRKRGLKHCKTLVQLAVNARNLMHAHGLTCTFLFGVYGEAFRICRFDHSGAVICEPLSLKKLADLKLVQQFFWNFVHPTEGNYFVGWDPTVRRLNDDDQGWLLSRLELAGVGTDDIVLPEARSVQVFDGESDGACEPQTYIAFKILDVNGRLFSRATTVWHGIRDTRRLVNGRLIDPAPSADDLRVRVIKEAWRQLVRRPEKEFYDRLDSVVPPQRRVGLPSLLCGGDLGEREVRLWESALYGAPAPTTPDDAHHKSRLSAPAPRPLQTPPPSLSASSSSTDHPTHRPMQQTFTWRQARGKKYWYKERSHMRFVVAEVGRPVTQFRTTKELVMAFRDAILGHRDAMAKGGILHRDISVGNILIVDDPSLQNQFCGFVHDFDYSSMSRLVPQGDISSLSAAALDKLLLADDFHGLLKERTGTFLFMASELLHGGSDPVVHAIHHDLESFYWALLWVVLRHTRHMLSHKKGQGREQTCPSVFQHGDPVAAQRYKGGWLQHDYKKLLFALNNPLTTLMGKFGRLVSQATDGHTSVLNYDSVLKIFNEALACPDSDWPPPSKDGPLEYVLPDPRTVNEWSSSSEVPPSHRHRRKRDPTDKGKQRATTEPDSEGEDDYDESWDESSDSDVDDPRPIIQAADDFADYAGVAPPSFDNEHPALHEIDDDDWQDAADVSAMLGYGDMDVDDEEPADGTDLIAGRLDGLVLSPQVGSTPAEPVPPSEHSGPEGATTSKAQAGRAPVRPRGVGAVPADGVDARQRPQTRAQTKQGSTSGSTGRGGTTQSGLQVTRSNTRAGNSGGTSRDGGSKTGSRGSRRVR